MNNYPPGVNGSEPEITGNDVIVERVYCPVLDDYFEAEVVYKGHYKEWECECGETHEEDLTKY